MCSKPKIPAATPVIERQPYKTPASRESLAGDAAGAETRRRMIAGVATSARGVEAPASTTRRVMAGGDAPIMPVLSGSGGATGAMPSPAPAPTGGGARAPQSAAQPTQQRKVKINPFAPLASVIAARRAVY